METENKDGNRLTELLKRFIKIIRILIFSVLSVGVIPTHIAFVLDGNRRYAKKKKLSINGAGHRAGFLSLMSILKYCTEVGVKYVTLYAFSIDNFKRPIKEVEPIMDLMLEKIEMLLKEGHIHKNHGLRLIFIGDLKLLGEPLRVAAEEAMIATQRNNKILVMICVAYSSSNELMHAVKECSRYKLNHKSKSVQNEDIEEHMYMSLVPDPDILIRTSGENRLSNFLLWQTPKTLLYSPAVLWPEISFWHLVLAILQFQHHYPHLERKIKKHS